MRPDLGAVLGSMGFKVKEEFIVDLAEDGLSASIRQWTSTTPQPSDAEIAAWDMSPAAQATRDAQVESSKATESVDKGVLQEGNRVQRLNMATVLVALDAINNDRAAFTAINNAVQAAASLADLKTRFAAINFPPQVTQQQLQNAVKNKLATFPT